jgi:hypothetical protein
VRLTYATGDEDALSYGIGFVRVGETVVLLVRGDAAASEARAGDLVRIEQTLTAPAPVPSPGAV